MAYVGTPFDPADPTESELFGFDFITELPPGDLPASVVFTCRNADSTPVSDPTPANRIIGSPLINGTAVFNKCGGGWVGGAVYVIEAVVTTAAGYTVSLWSFLQCVTPE